MSEENKKEIIASNKQYNKPSFISQITKLIVAVAVVAVVIILVFYFVKRLIWWILALASIVLLILNWKFVGKCLAWIKQQYTKNAVWGVLVTIAALAGSSIFIGFLFLKTIWDFAKTEKILANEKEETKRIE